MAVTSMYFPLGRPFKRSSISSFTLALNGPKSSSSDSRMPNSRATWRIGLSLASCAISMSEGTGRRSFRRVGVKADSRASPAVRVRLPLARFLAAVVLAFFGLIAMCAPLPPILAYY